MSHVVRWWRMVLLWGTLHWLLRDWFRVPTCRGFLCRLHWGFVWRWSVLLMPFLLHMHLWPVQFWNTVNFWWLGVCRHRLLLLSIFWFVLHSIWLLSIWLLFLFDTSLDSLFIGFNIIWGISQTFIGCRFITALCCQA